MIPATCARLWELWIVVDEARSGPHSTHAVDMNVTSK